MNRVTVSYGNTGVSIGEWELDASLTLFQSQKDDRRAQPLQVSAAYTPISFIERTTSHELLLD